nr:hypothetical protein [uncultured bacterium]
MVTNYYIGAFFFLVLTKCLNQRGSSTHGKITKRCEKAHEINVPLTVQ